MSLSDKKVMTLLQKHFVCGWQNIGGKTDYAGKSNSHDPGSVAVYTTNGAGSKNVQFLVVDPTGQVLHCLPGFWNPRDLVHELKFALQLSQLVATEKKANRLHDKILLAHLNHAAAHSGETTGDSELQGFDKRIEKARKNSAFGTHGSKACGLKTVDQVIHEKMAERPLMKLADFDIGAFVDYGTKFYDKHGDGCKHKKKKKRGESPEKSRRG